MRNLNILPLRLIMIAKDLNQTEFAKYFAVTRAYISAILKGQRVMDEETLINGLNNLGISVIEYTKLSSFCEMLDTFKINDMAKYRFGLIKAIGAVDAELKEQADTFLQQYFPEFNGLKGVKEVLADVIAKQLVGISKSDLAESYNSYTKYCFPELKEEWNRMTRVIVYQPLTLNKDMIIDPNVYGRVNTLANFMEAGEIMQTFFETKSWEEVDKVLDRQGHTGYTFSGMANVLILFSPMGVEFVDRYTKDRLERDQGFRDNYIVAKERINARNKLNMRLIKVLKEQV